MTRVAAVDCGTNSLRLLVADIDVEAVRADELDRRTTIVRLGQDVDRTGVFADEALARTFRCLDEYAAAIDDLDVTRVRFVATSAARDVANRDRFADGVRQRLGVEPEVITGDEEARLSFEGATRDVPAEQGPLGVLDIGGGSTELVVGGAGEVAGRSLDIGSVRLTERHLRHDPPTESEVASATAEIESALEDSPVGWDDVATLIGVAGTITTIAAMVLDLPKYDRERIHRSRLPSAQVLSAVESLVAMPVRQRAALKFMATGRADVIAGGALILASVVRRSGLDTLTVSEHDILDGIAWSILEQPDERRTR